jgi:hypothetical protein
VRDYRDSTSLSIGVEAGACLRPHLHALRSLALAWLGTPLTPSPLPPPPQPPPPSHTGGRPLLPTQSTYPSRDKDGNPLETEYGLSTYKDHQKVTIQVGPYTRWRVCVGVLGGWAYGRSVHSVACVCVYLGEGGPCVRVSVCLRSLTPPSPTSQRMPWPLPHRRRCRSARPWVRCRGPWTSSSSTTSSTRSVFSLFALRFARAGI